MNQEQRPPWQTCAHNGTFQEHVCWAITDKSLEHENTEQKFCGAKVDGVIRRFGHPLMGFMEPKQEDWMVQTKCIICEQFVLLRIGENKCQLCKDAESVLINRA